MAEAQNAADVLGCVATSSREAGLEGESRALRTASKAALQDLLDATGCLAGQRCGGVAVGSRSYEAVADALEQLLLRSLE
ncbi:unnamed protein product, partial [Polarella glacialis]